MPLHAIIMTWFRQIWNPGCYSSLTFNIGGGLEIGFETQLKIKNIPIQVSALASEKMILEVTKNGADIKNVISAQGGIGNLGYEYGREHS